MKTRNTFLAALVLGMLAASACATFDRAATEQEEIVTQIQKDQATSPVPQTPGTCGCKRLGKRGDERW